METVIRNVGDLDTKDRSALERVVGHHLQDGQKVVIQLVNPAVTSREIVPNVAGTQLPYWCRVYDGLTDEQIGDLDRSIVRSQSSRDIA
ncbi:hypothetical protein [Fimbriiglobus ruber]|uniref:Uncharacterized protein n=1 Tax=Fimbriiglobus ruber TaxID=1908690 RepID=A0A225DWL3_9BACT|nr:hypothetical protein [Fimbriiglobus ruber]OWK43974.1 hypothetical protein FRUB_03573 [Fimbriiglobus ruber]